MKIAIATTSELKVRASEEALRRFGVEVETIPIKTNSGVSDQPFGYEETTQGAKNRANSALSKIEAECAIGIESGLIEIEGSFFDVACVCIITKSGDESIAYSSGYFTPKWIIDEIKEKNTEYGHITQRLSGDTDKDPMKYFSNNIIKREELLSQAITVALVKIFNKDKYIQK